MNGDQRTGPARSVRPGSAHDTANGVLTWTHGTHHGHWSAVYGGRSYDLWKGLDGYWRVKVDGRNMAAEDGTSAWGVKASAQDAADRHARTTNPARASGNGGRA